MKRTIGVWLGAEMEFEGFSREDIKEAFVETLGEAECDTALLIPYHDTSRSFDEVLVRGGVVASWRSVGAEVWEFVSLDSKRLVFLNKEGGTKLSRVKI